MPSTHQEVITSSSKQPGLKKGGEEQQVSDAAALPALVRLGAAWASSPKQVVQSSVSVLSSFLELVQASLAQRSTARC